jgi:hypothetical protein
VPSANGIVEQTDMAELAGTSDLAEVDYADPPSSEW